MTEGRSDMLAFLAWAIKSWRCACMAGGKALLLLWGGMIVWASLAGAAGSLPPLVAEGEDLGTVEEVLAMVSPRGMVRAVAFSPDGRLLLTSSDKIARLWDITTGKELRRFVGHSRVVRSVAFSPDGTQLATGSSDHTARLWDVTTAKELRRFEGDSSSVSSVAFSPDGTQLATGSNDDTARLWDVATGKELRRFEGDSSWVISVAFSPDGTQLATGSLDNTVRLWDIITGKELRRFEGHSRKVTSVDFSPDGTKLATGSNDDTARLWDVATGRELQRFEGHSRVVMSVSFSPDGRTLATGSKDNTARLWDITTGKELRRFEVDEHSSWIQSVSFSPDGTQLAIGSDDDTALLWDVATGGELLQFEGHSDQIESISFSYDGRFLVTSLGNTARLWEVATGKEKRRFREHYYDINSVSLSPDGTQLATGSSDETARLWDVATGKELRRFEGNLRIVKSVSFSPNGTQLATTSYDQTVRLWDLATGKELRRFEGHFRAVSSVAFSPDGTQLATGSYDNTAPLWDVATGKKLQEFVGHSKAVMSVAFSPDGTQLATGSRDNTARLWDVATGKELRRFVGHSSAVTSVDFSPDGTQLATGSWDKTARLWDVKSGKTVALFLGGAKGEWLSFNYVTHQWLRADLGDLLQRFNQQNHRLEPVLFPKPEVLGSLTIDVLPATITASDGKITPLEIQLRNDGAGAAHWISVQQLDHYSSPLTFFPPQHIMRLDSGASVILHAGVAFTPPLMNPQADGTATLHLRLTTAYGAPLERIIQVQARTPTLHLAEASFLHAKGDSSLVVHLQNSGNQSLARASAVLTITGLDVELPTQILNGLPASNSQRLIFPLPDNFQATEHSRFNLQVKQFNKDSALHIWQFNDQTAKLAAPDWQYYLAITLLMGVIGAAIYYQRNYRHPLVRKLRRHPQGIEELSLGDMARALNLLKRVKLLNGLLQAVNIQPQHLALGLQFVQRTSAAEGAKLLSGRLYVACEAQADKRMFVLRLNKYFPLNVNKVLMVFTEAGRLPQDLFNELRSHDDASSQVCMMIAADDATQWELNRLASDCSDTLFAPTPVEIATLMLDAEPQEALAKVLAHHLSLAQISPYQTGGGTRKASIFFGRLAQISQIMNKEPANYLLVGGRQLGKSSLLKELERRYEHHPRVDCRYFTLSSGNIIKPWARCLGLAVSSSLDAIVDCINTQQKPMLLLIDEADKFIHNENKADYATLQAMRALSEEGRAFFVLAGFWQLYQHVALDYQSPLKNFGEMINLGALEVEACHELATVPMATMHLSYEAAALTRLLAACGGRPNLISIACAEVIKGLSAKDRSIHLKMVDVALDSEAIRSVLSGWDTLAADDEAGQKLVRIIVYGTLDQERFTQGDIIDQLNTLHVAFDTVDLEHLLQRLVLAFVLGREQGNYFYRVPLFKEYLRSRGSASQQLQNAL